MYKNILVILISLFVSLYTNCQINNNIPFWDFRLSFDQRAYDIVSRLTLDEKVNQMINHAPSIKRYGIPAYDWWNEVLHGVARTPYNTTSYPQAIAMAATWDTISLKLMAQYSAMEGRAVHNKAILQGKNNERYMGLTYWTPNINIFRDPRWGRGQETYGEDPYLTSKFGAAFVRGLQGDDKKYLLAAACAKHFAVHSGPESSRHTDDINPTVYDLWDTYLPAFRELVTQANVEGVMCAYNALKGQPCCGNDLLMTDILRNQWKFKGYVTSDCWAIDDFFKYHKTHPDAISAAVDAVIHGTDVECGKDVYLSLVDGVKKGLINESQLDISLRRLFTTRLKLGMFDPPELVKFSKINDSELESQEHEVHALKMARQCIVLLKNENNTLPLSKNLKKIVIFGPNADNKISILGNYNGTPSKIVSLYEGIKNKLGPETELIFEQAINFTNDQLLVYKENNNLYQFNDLPGFKAEYFNNEDLSGFPALVIQEKELNHYWNEGQSPEAGINSEHFSARFQSNYTPNKGGNLNFEIEGDDGYKLFINDSLYLDAWTRNRWGAKQFSISAESGKSFKITVEFKQREGNSFIRLRQGEYVKTDFNSLIRKHNNADAFIYAGGISPQLEGEEMTVNFPGFNGGDRTTILLPEIQSKFLGALQQSGKKVIFVMMTGSAIAITEEDKNIPAIMNAWYGGQAAGTAIADVLFGDYNPGGKLPVTFYKNDTDLPDFKNYDMTGRTYRYFKGEPLYPFGYGLSYSKYEYTKLKAPKFCKPGNKINVSATVENKGKSDGEEVIQLYVDYPDYIGKKPIRALKGFKRVGLKAGERKVISFELRTDDLQIIDADGIGILPFGNVNISVGGGQPGVSRNSSNILSKLIRIKPSK